MSRVTGVQVEGEQAVITLEDTTSVRQVAIPLAELAGRPAAEARALVRQAARPAVPVEPPAVVALRAALLGQVIE